MSASPPSYTHEIRVSWADCDPAKIVYTARIPWFALDAINAWWEDTYGEGWFQMETDHGFGTPFVNMNIDFRAPVTPRHRLLCDVYPTRLGTTSISFRVIGRQNGTLCFEGSFTNVFVTAEAFAKSPPPADVRAHVLKYLRDDA
ncbi:acyl-CoA thioesterase [Tropicibacter naphthalenivorans]|uniref:Thioesterase superfamily protein n=1 Tax=Tropicibacter naphthalenivorans TaxID=441103 RepID=A0A0P1GJG4_9RHOB|nr:thioesterase family protein [Tropicibacter naphthalenivorans]CUH82082.1 Thioesterase superfamily protein [Tropicibacter naphthalenivorans]SMD08472.1 Acyl-CoA thioesterase FadM [Tropicibacter naphthalenivorans]